MAAIAANGWCSRAGREGGWADVVEEAVVGVIAGNRRVDGRLAEAGVVVLRDGCNPVKRSSCEADVDADGDGDAGIDGNADAEAGAASFS